MNKRDPFSPFAAPLMMAQLAASSWETIWHRSVLMATGKCSLGEYQRMVTEKTAAVHSSMWAFCTGQSHAAVVAPFLNRASANAKRLRR